MKKLVIAAAVAALGVPVSAQADTVEERLAALEARLVQMEARIGDQARELQEKDARIAELEQRPATTASATAANGSAPWFERVNMTGLMQIDVAHVSPEHGDDTSDVTAHKLELGLEAQINDWVRGDILIKHEESTDKRR
jgi:hypothetical protein